MSQPAYPWEYQRLALRYEVICNDDPVTLSGPAEVARFCQSMINLTQESYVWLALDAAKQLVAARQIALGAVDKCYISAREIFQTSLVLAPTIHSIILVHNHPSGRCLPSEADRQHFQEIHRISEILQVPLLDNLIVARDGWWSETAQGRVDVTDEIERVLCGDQTDGQVVGRWVVNDHEQ